MLVPAAASLSGNFLPQGWCFGWDPGMVWLHAGSDLLITLAYYLISFSLLYTVKRRRDLAVPWMYLCGVFILACGTTHLMDVLVIWKPWYHLDDFVRSFTALASVTIAILLIRLVPAAITLPSPKQLQDLNEKRENEIAERKIAEAEVRELNKVLEERVQQRTAELEDLNLQLRESENRLQSIMDSSPALIFLKDVQGRYQFVNRHFEATFGVRRDQLTGCTDFDIFPRSIADAYAATDREVLKNGTAQEFEELAFHGGEAHTYISNKFPLFDESGRPYAICSISTDITERKRAEQALRHYNSELEQFAYIAAHDLQEPLRNVKSYAQLLTKRYNEVFDEESKEIIGFITAGVDRLQALMSGLQSYAELNRQERHPLVSDGNAILKEVLNTMEPEIREVGASVIADPLPPVRVHALQLGQCFQNLISNALKYRSAEPPVIQIGAIRLGHEYEFVVADNGMGLDMKYADYIFGVFRRLHGREVPGTGIGLAICKKVIESHGGRIWVVSEPGKGSEFHFTLFS